MRKCNFVWVFCLLPFVLKFWTFSIIAMALKLSHEELHTASYDKILATPLSCLINKKFAVCIRNPQNESEKIHIVTRRLRNFVGEIYFVGSFQSYSFHKYTITCATLTKAPQFCDNSILLMQFLCCKLPQCTYFSNNIIDTQTEFHILYTIKSPKPVKYLITVHWC